MLSYLLAGATLGPVVSQSMLDLCISIIFVCLVTYYLRRKEFNFRLRKPYLFEYGFILYFLAVIIGFVIFKPTDSEAWLQLLKFNWVINFYIFTWAFSQTNIDFKKWAYFFGVAYIIPNIYAILALYFQFDIVNYHNIDYARLLGLVNSATYHAHGNGIILAFFLTLLFFTYKTLDKFVKLFVLVGFSLMFCTIFLTFTRGVWLSLTFTALIFLFIHQRKVFITSILAGTFLCITLFFTLDMFRDRVLHSFQTQGTDHERWDLWDVHAKIISDNPVFGITYAKNLSHTPPETWVKYGYDEDNINSHAHNQLLNVLTTTGIVGLIPFALFYFWFLITNIKLVKKFKQENLQNHYILATACLMAQIEFIIANLTDIGFEYAKIRSLILLVWAIVFCLWKNRITFSQPAPLKNR